MSNHNCIKKVDDSYLISLPHFPHNSSSSPIPKVCGLGFCLLSKDYGEKEARVSLGIGECEDDNI